MRTGIDMPIPPTLKTQRLLLKPLGTEDAPWIQKYFDDFEIIKYIGHDVPWPYPPDGAESYIKMIQDQMAELDVYAWAIRLKKAPDETIGAIEYRFRADKKNNRGFWIARDYHGQGLMSEAVAATQDYVFLDLGKERILTYNAPSNTASRRLKEKFGGRLFSADQQYAFYTGEKYSEVWEVTRQKWLELRDSLPYKKPKIV
jgi:RimJ/RimL family protein N-acetyltransferase